MLPFFKRFILFSLTLILVSTLNAQDDTIIYRRSDSLQDIQIRHLNQQINVVRSLLRKNTQWYQHRTDSLKSVNEAQADRIYRLSEESELLTEKLASAFEEIEDGKINFQESQKNFRTIYFITVPVLLLVALSVLAILLLLLTRHKNSTNDKITALRKYTYEGIEEVRADYIGEIKRRVKKIAAKLKGSGKSKGKNKSGSNKKKSDSKTGTKSSSSSNTKSKKKE